MLNTNRHCTDLILIPNGIIAILFKGKKEIPQGQGFSFQLI